MASFKLKSLLLFLLIYFIGARDSFAQVKTDQIAEKMLVYQRSYGGWPKAFAGKKIVYEQDLSDDQIRFIKRDIDAEDATIDNKATSREIRYLAKAYKQTSNVKYLQAVQKGLDYLLVAQYDNGGWPQYYPAKNLYRGQVTYNDDAMVNVLNILQDIVEKTNDFDVLDASYTSKSIRAIDKATQCILNTQVKVNGGLTAWAAQYDEKSLMPAKARAFEPASLSSSESVGIVRFLMRLPNPSAEIKTAIFSAMDWFEKVKIAGFATKNITSADQPTGKDRILVSDETSTIWARFYDIQTFEPIFIGRDAVIRKRLSEIDNERRVGYAWYGTWPQKLKDHDFAKWKKNNGL
ncbi:pectate lyase [Desertivirga xinjiangensis]|uniref:pectate lyase n=1 Tax=Desertivirga xinjiangensis TaxID=539206 RepID=UPI00210862A3|nr:pectate lyase [Pedobacter xinjiangensis]